MHPSIGGAVAAMQRTDHHIILDRQLGEGLDELEGARDPGGADLIGAQPEQLRSARRTWPVSGGSAPAIRLKVVVLPGAVRTDQRDDAILGHRERHVLDRLQGRESAWRGCRRRAGRSWCAAVLVIEPEAVRQPRPDAVGPEHDDQHHQAAVHQLLGAGQR
ncbi:MAG: hypothetical protein WDO24_13290 [Pseudomonadota bacterium]